MERESIKVCKGCLKEKYHTEFYSVKGNPGKRQSRCKECRRQWQRHYYRLHRNEIIDYVQDYYKEHKSRMQDLNIEWKEKNKERVAEYRKTYYYTHQKPKQLRAG